MSFTVEKRDDISAIIITFHTDFGGGRQIKRYVSEIVDLLDNCDGPVYQIVDSADLKLSFNDVMLMIKEAVTNKQVISNHPNSKGIVIVTNKRFYKMAAKGLNTRSFGHLKLEIFESLDEALNWVREQAA